MELEIQANERLTKVKEKSLTIKFGFLFYLSFSLFQCPKQQIS